MEKISLKKPGMILRFATGIVLITGAVLFPQIIHLIGKWSQSGNLLGTIILPMHFTVLISGLILGPLAGGLIGFFSPLISYSLTGMPTSDQVFLMCIELASYGLSSGLISHKKISVPVKILIAQIIGRAVKLLTSLLILAILPDITFSIESIALTYLRGVPGVIMQICLISCLFYNFKGFTMYYE